MAARLNGLPGVAAIELNISCPNVSHGVDLGIDPEMCRRVVAGCRAACRLPIIAKLTPNVTNIAAIAEARPTAGPMQFRSSTPAGHGGRLAAAAADAGQCRGRPERAGDQADRLAVCLPDCPRGEDPVIGIGGIATIDDVMEFLVAGATAVQIGTANFYNPTVSMTVARRSCPLRWRS